MADIKIFPYPDQFAVSDQEVEPGKPVRSMTWTSVAHLINHLNFFARRVLPWTSWGQVGGVGTFDFVYPVDGPAYSTRRVVVVVALTRSNLDYLSGPVQMTVKSSTDTTGTTATFAEGTSNTSAGVYTEESVNYVFREITVTGGRREKIEVTITSTSDRNVIGFGAWELPPANGGAKSAMAAGGGVSLIKADIDGTVSNVVDPAKYFATKEIDTDLADIHKGAAEAWRSNRRIIYNIGFITNAAAANPIDLYAANDSAWHSVTGEGLYVPPYVNNLGRTTRKVRIAVKLKNAGAGTGHWRATDSGGNPSSEDSVSNTTLQWRPMGSPYDPTVDGLQLEIPLAGGRVHLQTNSAGAEPHIYQVIIWEDEPDLY